MRTQPRLQWDRLWNLVMIPDLWVMPGKNVFEVHMEKFLLTLSQTITTAMAQRSSLYYFRQIQVLACTVCLYVCV